MALQRTNQELSIGITERTNTELRNVQAQASQLKSERDLLKDDLARAEAKIRELQAECSSAVAAADDARAQHKHYKVNKHSSLHLTGLKNLFFILNNTTFWKFNVSIFFI